MDNRLNGINPLAYTGVAPLSVPQLVYFNFDPTTTDSKNYSIGALWVNRTTLTVWVLVNLALGVATWIKFAASSGFASSFPTDSGTAVPTAGGALTIAGGSNINTAGSASIVTVNLDNTVSISGSFTAVGNISTTTGGIYSLSNSTSSSGVLSIANSNDTSGAVIQTVKYHGVNNPAQNGDELGTFGFLGFDGTDPVDGALIRSIVQGPVSTNVVPANLEFYTTNLSGSRLQRVVIGSTGTLTINTPDSGGALAASGTITGTTLYASADAGGVVSTNALSNGSNLAANSTGTFTIASKTANNATSAGFLKVYVGTTAYWVPLFTNPAP